MSLSESTLLLFVFLLPGLVFPYFLYHRSIIKKELLSSNPILASLAVLLYACGIHLLSCSLIAATIKSLSFVGYSLDTFAYYGNEFYILEAGGAKYSIGQYAFEHPIIPVAYIGITLLVATWSAKLVRWLADWCPPIQVVLYGPMAPIARFKGAELISAFVLTNITKDALIVMYSGFPLEIGLKGGTKIDYIVLQSPEKFYLKLDSRAPKTTLDRARPISPDSNSALFIAGSQIENVHFEYWGFNR